MFVQYVIISVPKNPVQVELFPHFVNEQQAEKD